MTAAGKDRKLAEEIRRRLEEGLGSGSAAAFALVRDGELLCSAAAGTLAEDGSPCGTEDLFNIGSVSKVFCAAAVMKLRDTGTADPDTPLCELLPRFVMRDERYRKITLRMCLNHSTGLPGTLLKDAYADRSDRCGRFADTLFRCLAETGLKAEPGSRSVYCNDGFDLACAAVSEVSGLSYTAFLKKHLAAPLGIRSLCTPEDFPDGFRLVTRRGFGREYLYSLGSGGIAMRVEDCARFGWSFLCPGEILSAASAAEMAVPQRLAADPADAAMRYGLGWDDVAFTCPELDLGPGALLKSGGTPSFISYLLVSPALRLSAAISATRDIGRHVLPFFLKLLAFALGAEETAAVRPEREAPAQPRPLPDALAARFSGTYFSSLCVYRASFEDGCLVLSRLAENGRTACGEPAPFDGEGFRGVFDGEAVRFSFTSLNGTDYLNVIRPYKGLSQIAEKPGALPPADPAWAARDGRRYLLESGHNWDISVGSTVAGLELRTFRDSGVVLAKIYGMAGSFSVIPAAARDADAASMFLTASEGGRNQFELTVSREDGREHLHCAGYSFLETDAVPAFVEDAPLTGPEDGCACFRIRERVKLPSPHGGTRIILLDGGLHVTADSRVTRLPETADAGYLIVLSDAPQP